MAVTYTNHKGLTYTLYRTETKTGKDRYYFAKSSSRGEPCETIPEGFEIWESPHGLVSLAKVSAQTLLQSEVALIRAVLAEHPQSSDYQTHVQLDRIIIYERIGPDMNRIVRMFERNGISVPEEKEKELQEDMGADAIYEEVLRFILSDESEREFVVERMCYLGACVSGPFESQQDDPS